MLNVYAINCDPAGPEVTDSRLFLRQDRGTT
jgi:hypothetical protein